MSFRVRLTLLVALAIAITVAAASAAVWVVAKHELLTQFDQKLVAQATNGHGPSPFDRGTYSTYIRPDGSARGVLPVTSRAMRIATGKNRNAYFTDATVKDTTGTSFHLRELVAPTYDEEGTHTGAVIVAQSLQSTDHALARIRFWILLVGGIGIASAAAIAAFVATAALRPVRRLTAAAETVAATGDLSERVDVHGDDELGRLAVRFNAMLEAQERLRGVVLDSEGRSLLPRRPLRTRTPGCRARRATWWRRAAFRATIA